MYDNYSPQEILKIAVKVEESGRKFYEGLENKTKNQEVKELCAYLKRAEERHAKTFQEMLDNLGDYIIHELAGGEYESYLRAIASEYVFTQELMEKKAKEGFNSETQALDFGIKVEKDSILVYSALKEYVLTAKQAVLDKVIEEEKKHLIQLSLLKAGG